jgi:FAD/FMN-containing dehydrogenase
VSPPPARGPARSRLRTLTKEHRVEILWPRSFSNSFEWLENPSIDHGRYQVRRPSCIFQPQDRRSLAATLHWLSEEGIPFKVRARGHSAGGQTLHEGGVVVDTRRLSQVRASLHQSVVIADGGTQWREVLRILRPLGLRPCTLIDEQDTTVGGTLSVGGFGDTAHINGTQVSMVRRLTVATLDGELHDVSRGDELFDYVLAGRGQLAVIAEAEIAVVERPTDVHVGFFRFADVRAFVRAIPAIRERASQSDRRGEFSRARVWWPKEGGAPVTAVIGGFGLGVDCDWPGAECLERGIYDPYEEPPDRSPSTIPCPALEWLTPLDTALEQLDLVHARLLEHGVAQWLPYGASINVIAGRDRLPLEPFADDSDHLLVALRPRVAKEDVDRVHGVLQEIGAQLVEEGAKIYLMSIEVPAVGFAQRQFGSSYARFLELKQRYDPDHLLNSGLLPKKATHAARRASHEKPRRR